MHQIDRVRVDCNRVYGARLDKKDAAIIKQREEIDDLRDSDGRQRQDIDKLKFTQRQLKQAVLILAKKTAPGVNWESTLDIISDIIAAEDGVAGISTPSESTPSIRSSRSKHSKHSDASGSESGPADPDEM